MAFRWQVPLSGTAFREFTLFAAQRSARHAFPKNFVPSQKQTFATSVETSIEHKSSLPNILKFSYCPYCYALHGWSPDEAFFDDTEYEIFLSEATNTAASAGTNVTNVSRRRRASTRKRTARGRLRSIIV